MRAGAIRSKGFGFVHVLVVVNSFEFSALICFVYFDE